MVINFIYNFIICPVFFGLIVSKKGERENGDGKTEKGE